LGTKEPCGGNLGGKEVWKKKWGKSVRVSVDLGKKINLMGPTKKGVLIKFAEVRGGVPGKSQSVD